ncbi:MAG: 3-hydroxyacyl-CoA dehydrogenase family protein [Peptococcaceae bacterium]|nr:3-hydroxyacyl-CoA dehydrogenase family protein [Peptococcaceae bacterium]
MKVAVIGSGVMGPGIAQVFMTGGHEVALQDISEKALGEGAESIRKSIALMHEKGILENGEEKYMPLLSVTTSLGQAVEGSRLVVEAVPERPDIKQALFSELDRLCPEDAVIVSNTSSLPLPEIFPDFRPGKFFVCHFFNPPPIIPLVELVISGRTDKGAVDWLKGELVRCGKKPIVVKGFVLGFLVNRLQTAMAREALHLINRGIVGPEDVDTAVTAAIGFKSAWQGMFDTMDYIGLDTVAMAYGVIFPDLCNDTGVPPEVTEKVREGHLGVKSGRGFFNYEGGRAAEVMEKRQALLLDQLKLWKKHMT